MEGLCDATQLRIIRVRAHDHLHQRVHAVRQEVDGPGRGPPYGALRPAWSPDSTIHRDEALRQAYSARHGSKENWGRTGVMTPGWLSRHLLWEKRSLRAAAAAASTMYPDVRFRLT